MEENGGKEIWKEFACCPYFGMQKASWLLSEVLCLRGGIIGFVLRVLGDGAFLEAGFVYALYCG